MSWGTVLSGVGSLLGAGGGILSSLGIGGGGEKDTYHPEVWRNDRTKDYMRMMRDITLAAKEYGFHPLTLLGAGYGGGTPYAQPIGGQNPYIGDAVGHAASALGQIGELYQSDQDRADAIDAEERARMDQIAADTIAAAEREKADQVRQAEIRRLDSETLLNTARSRTEAAQLQAVLRGGVASGMSSLAPQMGDLIAPDGSVWRAGKGSGAQDWEDRYGSIVGEFLGLGNYFRDLWGNTPPPKLPTGSYTPNSRFSRAPL